MLNNTIGAIVEYVKVACDHSAPPRSPMNGFVAQSQSAELVASRHE